MTDTIELTAPNCEQIADTIAGRITFEGGLPRNHYSPAEQLASALAALGMSPAQVGQRMADLHPGVTFLTDGNYQRALTADAAAGIIVAIIAGTTVDRDEKNDRFGQHRVKAARYRHAPKAFGEMLAATLSDLCATASVPVITLHTAAALQEARALQALAARAEKGHDKKGTANVVALLAAFKRVEIELPVNVRALPDINNVIAAIFEPVGINNEAVARFLQHRLNPDGGDITAVNDKTLGKLATRNDIWDALAAAYKQVVERNTRYAATTGGSVGDIRVLRGLTGTSLLTGRLKRIYADHDIDVRELQKIKGPQPWMHKPLEATGSLADVEAAYASHPLATDFERLPPNRRALPSACSVQANMWCDAVEKVLMHRKA